MPSYSVSNYKCEPVRGVVHGDCHCHGFVRGRRTTPCNAPSSYRTCQSSKSILRLSERLSPSVWQTPSLRREQQQTTDALGMNGPKSDENGLPSRKIVFAVDGTTDAEEGLRWVVKEIARKGDTVHLAHVVCDPRTPATAVGSSTAATQWSPSRDEALYAREFFARMEHEARGMLANRFVPSLQFSGINCEIDILKLKVHRSAAGIGEQLSNRALDLGAELLIIASHGAGVLADYGSVARWCSENSPTPVLLLPPSVLRGNQSGSRSVVVAATDNLEGLHQAFDFAVEHLAHPGDSVYVLHIQQPFDNEEAAVGRKGLANEVLKWQENSRHPYSPTLTVAVEMITEPASESTNEIASASLSFDSHSCSPAAERVCQHVEDISPRAVVLNHHGKSFMREMMYSPMTLHCTKHCCRPLVVLGSHQPQQS